MSEPLRFDGRVVLITGGARGMGRAHADLLASRGASVLISDVGIDLYGNGGDDSIVAEAVAAIKAQGGTVEGHSADLMQEEGARDAVRRAIDQFGRIDALVHNAGFTLGSMPFEGESLDRLDKQLGVNVRAGYALVQEAWPHFQKQGGGSVILTGSTAMYGLPRSTPYSAAKAGYLGLARALAGEGAPQAIRVNAIAPAGATRMSDNMPASAFRDWFTATMRPELVSPLVAWLAHPDCTISGETFVVGGGRVARTLFSETEGYVNPAMTIESLRDNQDAVMSADRQRPIPTFQSSMDIAMELFGFDPGGDAIGFSGKAGS
ncbi:SDR family NAD(P)-dependent oxidoreductase [Sphingomonas crocodyli]|uniref:SDR family oxidoreductase n=1 Tax=Sphingomonas crocodyli TaxID=1979270 RepID=A0A437M6P2_9SPHN|nr:SDR family NAD(P)-dependent oxidoreductase [Sphingomonas crocodyli]RVT93225.1 SDR family oxidoreductase [Sphingomonas crocodyli]